MYRGVPMALQYQILKYIQHLESVEVRFTHNDLPNAYAQIIVPLPKESNHQYSTGTKLAEAIISYAPNRVWFEEQESRLTADLPSIAALPEELKQFVPVVGTIPVPEWNQKVVLSEPKLVNGTWCRKHELVPETNIDALQNNLVAKVAAVRFERETQGIVLNGEVIRTDRESQATVTSAWVKAKADPTTSLRWKAASGWVDLDANTIILIGDSVFEHVQECFTQESQFVSQIMEATTIEELEAINEALANW